MCSHPRFLRPLTVLTLPPPLGKLDAPAIPGWAPAQRADPTKLPRLTVVTPSFNQAQYLEATMRSVLEQGYPNLEYLVIDGNSRDRSVEIIRYYAPFLSYWVSEPDSGQVEAIDKGLRRATGEWFVWINSDDLLAPGALWKIAGCADDADLIAGATCHFDAAGLRQTYLPRNITCENVIRELLQPGARWQQPSTWFRTAKLRQLGLNRGLHFAFDYELMVRYLCHFPRVRYLDDTLAYFRLHDASKTVSQAPRFLQEQIQIYRELQQDAALAPVHAILDEVERKLSWRIFAEALLDDRGRPRMSRVLELMREVRRDPKIRCDRTARGVLRRLMVYGGRRSNSQVQR